MASFPGYGKLIVDDVGRLIISGGSPGILASTDGGFTWEFLPINENLGAGYMLKSATGRSPPCSGGRRKRSEQRVFFYSDDKGEIWKTSAANMIWGEGLNEIVECQSGCILVLVNNFSSFENRLLFSDDDGDT